MKIKICFTFLVLTIAEISLAQVRIVENCAPIPTEVSGIVCPISLRENHLAIRIENESDFSQVNQSILDAMESHGFVELSENTYWYPNAARCYFSLYQVGEESIVFVSSFRRVLNFSYCNRRPAYDANIFGAEIERKLARNGLLDAASIYFTDIDVDSVLFENILESGGTPGLMNANSGEILTIDMQY